MKFQNLYQISIHYNFAQNRVNSMYMLSDQHRFHSKDIPPNSSSNLWPYQYGILKTFFRKDDLEGSPEILNII